MELISAFTAVLAILITIVGYFVKKHIESVEKSIKALNSKTVALNQDIIWIKGSIENIKEIVLISNKESRESFAKVIAKIESLDDLSYENKILLKKHEKDLENYGAVIRKKFPMK